MARPATLTPQDEDALQIEVAEFLRWAWPAELPWWHTPNGGKREQVTRTDRRTGRTYRFSPEAAKLKRMGVLSGVADLAFILPNGQAAFIELKVGANTQSDDQIDFQAAVKARGCAYVVCRSLVEVERVLTRWLAAFGLTLKARTTQFALTPPISPRSAA